MLGIDSGQALLERLAFVLLGLQLVGGGTGDFAEGVFVRAGLFGQLLAVGVGLPLPGAGGGQGHERRHGQAGGEQAVLGGDHASALDSSAAPSNGSG